MKGLCIPSDCRKFHSAVRPLFVCVFVLSMLGLICVALKSGGFHVDWFATAVASAFVLVSSMVVAWLLSIVYPAGFSAEGIYGHSFWGGRRFVRWQDIAVARSFRLLNLRWLRIYTADYSKVIWLALFQSHKAEFRQELQRFAPAGSPMSKHFP